MTRRSFSKPSEQTDHGDRPSLEKVLEHYGVEHKYRTTQMVRCPIHGDYTTPSCSVNFDKQLWNCHSCGAGGDSWALIMEKEGLDFERAHAYAAVNGLADGDAGGGGGVVRSRYDRGGRGVSTGSGTDGGNRPYAPSWRRRRSDPGA